MIKKLLLPALALLVLASCSNKMSLVKRKYNKGFYVSVSKKNHSEQIAKESSANKTLKPLTLNPTSEVVNNEAKVQKENLRETVSTTTSLKTTDIKNRTTITASAHSKEQTKMINHFVKPLKSSQLMKVSYAAKGGDTNKVVLVILALFPILCLIAVYLHDNSVTLNFWITLLLHLTFIGAMIFAVLVVLDIVNLA